MYSVYFKCKPLMAYWRLSLCLQWFTMDEIVITGISGRLPESNNLEEFWENLINGVDMVTEDNRRWTPGKASYLFLCCVYPIQGWFYWIPFKLAHGPVVAPVIEMNMQ